MSKRCSIEEFKRTRFQWTNTFSPVSQRELEAWQRDWADVLAEISYLSVGKISVTDSLGALVGLKGSVGFMGVAGECVQVDIEKMWAHDLASGLIAYHSFQELPDGFGFHFCALTGADNYVTGGFRVEKRRVTS